MSEHILSCFGIFLQNMNVLGAWGTFIVREAVAESLGQAFSRTQSDVQTGSLGLGNVT